MATSLTGPFGCQGARGSVGGITLTMHPKAGQVIKMKPRPSNPRSVAQMGNRHMFGFVGAQWAALTVEIQAAWEVLGSASQISGFAAYSKYNANRWAINKYPSKAHPAAETQNPTTSGSLAVVDRSDGPDSATFTITAGAHDWGVAFFRKTDGTPTGLKTELIAVRLLTPSAPNVLVVDHDGEDADLFRCAVFTDDGARQGTLEAPA